MKINIAFEIVKESGNNNPYYMTEGIDGVGGYYGTDTKAKRQIKAKIETKIKESLELALNTQTAFIFCQDLTILFVSFRDQWGYAITRPGQKTTGYVHGQEQTFRTCLNRAKEHAKNYGGIISVSH
jgi:hypothetical protein